MRDLLVDAQMRLAAAVADACMVRREPETAVLHLEAALRRRPERLELARRLASAYEYGGMSRRAAEVRADYGIDEGGHLPASPSAGGARPGRAGQMP